MSPVDGELLRLLEAVLFAASEPLPERALAARLPEDADLEALLAHLKADYAGRGVNLVRAGNTWAFRTAPDLAARLTEEVQVARKPSRAAIEILAIIAYHQPVTRAEIEEIRGVGLSRGTLDVLLEAGWIRPRGRRRTPGRPVTWGTTDGFLDHFGLESTEDLPGVEDLKAAGLLDARPAIEAARQRDVPAAAESADGEDAAQDEAPMDEDVRAADDEPPEPLDPDAAA